MSETDFKIEEIEDGWLIRTPKGDKHFRGSIDAVGEYFKRLIIHGFERADGPERFKMRFALPPNFLNHRNDKT